MFNPSIEFMRTLFYYGVELIYFVKYTLFRRDLILKKILFSIAALLIACSIPLTRVSADPTENRARFNEFITTELGQIQLHDFKYTIDQSLDHPSFNDISPSGDGYAAYLQTKDEDNSWIFTYYKNCKLEAIVFAPKNRDLSSEFLNQFGKPDNIKANSQGTLLRYGEEQGEHFSLTQRDHQIVLVYYGNGPFLDSFGTLQFKTFAENCRSTSEYRAQILQSSRSLGANVVAWVKSLF